MVEIRFGEVISKFLQDRNASTLDIANALGVSRATVYNWLSDKTPIPVWAFFEIAEYFGVSGRELLGMQEVKDGLHVISNCYSLLNEEGKASLVESAKMHALNPKFREERNTGEVSA